MAYSLYSKWTRKAKKLNDFLLEATKKPQELFLITDLKRSGSVWKCQTGSTVDICVFRISNATLETLNNFQNIFFHF